MKIVDVDRRNKKIKVRSGVFTITCRITDDGYVIRPTGFFVEDGEWGNFIYLVKNAWEDSGERNLRNHEFARS